MHFQTNLGNESRFVLGFRKHGNRPFPNRFLVQKKDISSTSFPKCFMMLFNRVKATSRGTAVLRWRMPLETTSAFDIGKSISVIEETINSHLLTEKTSVKNKSRISPRDAIFFIF